MLRLLQNVIPFFAGRSAGRFGQRVGGRRAGMALGTIASIAAPFVIRKLMQRRDERAAARAY